MKQPSFPILMYHALAPPIDDERERESVRAHDPQLRDPGAHLYALDVRTFENQVRTITRHGFETPRVWADLEPKDPTKRIWLTFDDGHQSNFHLALPALEQFGRVAIFFITTAWIGQPGFMTEDQILALRQAGQLIGAHGHTHRYLSDLSDQEILRELMLSKSLLESILGEFIPAMSLPGGRADRRLQHLAARVGYAHVFTSEVRLASPADTPLAWPRIPVIRRQPADFLEKILSGDDAPVRAMARSARLRRLAQQILGNPLYDRLRDWMLK